MHKAMLFLALTVGVGLAIPCWAQELPTLEATTIEAAPTIDGDLSDKAWEQATRLTGFKRHDGEETAQTPTTALVCYDDAALYVGFICVEPQTDKLKADATAHDDLVKPVSRDDCVEFFIVPGSGGNYYHFLVNSRNIRQDQRNWGYPRRPDNAWDGEWQSATEVNAGKNWVVEMAIPWYNFAADLGKRNWSAQFCRARHAGATEYSSYSFCDGSFHNTKRFARLSAPKVDFSHLLGFELYNIRVESYGVEPEGYSYTVEALLRSATARKVRLMLEDRPSAGDPAQTTQELTLEPGQGEPIAAQMKIAALGPRKLALQLNDSESGEPLYVNAFSSEIFPNLLIAYLDRNYYTREKTAQAIFALNIPHLGAPLFAEAVVELPGKKKSIRQRIKDPRRTVAEIALKSVPVGSHPVTLRVVDQAKHTIASVPFILRKEKPAPEGVREVKVDHDRRIALVDGKPFFPIAVYSVPADLLGLAAKTGFNLVFEWGGSRAGELKKAETPEEKRKVVVRYADAAHEHGLLTILVPCQFCPYDIHYGSPKFHANMAAFIEKDLPKVIEAARSHPAVIGYFGPDEPSEPYRDDCQAFFDVVREVDPYHLHHINYCQPLPDWRGIYDVAGRDYYPTADIPLIGVYKTVAPETRRCAMRAVPYWHVPLMELSSARRVGWTDPQQQAQIYLTLVAGAKGILWWPWPPRYKDNWEAIQRLVKEMKALTPILIEREPPQEIAYSKPETRDTLKVLVKNYAGKTYIIAVNANENPLQATFRLPTQYQGAANLWFEERSLPVRGGSFSDSFPGHGRHVYELQGSWPNDGALTLDINVQAAKERQVAAAEKEEVTPTNLILGPGFESKDYWHFGSGTNQDKTVGGFVTDDINSGKQAISIKSPYPEGRASFEGRQVRLEANTRYVFGGRMKKVGGRASIALRTITLAPSTVYLAKISRVNSRDRAGWDDYSVSFRTKESPMFALPMCTLEGDGEAWFDDLYLYRPEKDIKNFVRNSGMERDTPSLPGWVEGWDSGYSILDPGFIGDPNGPWTPDTKVFYEGKRSLRIEKRTGGPASGPLDRKNGVIAAYGSPGSLLAGDYTYSLYMKADKPGTRVWVMADWRQHKQFQVSDKWERYTFQAKQEEAGAWKTFWVSLVDPGKLWIDAVQVEKGDQATEYQEGE